MKPGETFKHPNGKEYVAELYGEEGCAECDFNDNSEECFQAPDCDLLTVSFIFKLKTN